jgi:dienelactone hydrolase
MLLLAATIAACGKSGDNNGAGPVGGSPGVSVGIGKTDSKSAADTDAQPQPDSRPAAGRRATYVGPTARLALPSGKTPAVVLLPDTGKKSVALNEAQKLAKLGLAVTVVEGPASAPTSVVAFEDAVKQARLAVNDLRNRAGIDPARIGVIGEGIGAHVAAVAIGRRPGTVLAAALADIGGTVVPSPKYAPERWLARARGTYLMFERDLGKRAMTKEEIKRLLLAAPPGTLMQEYKDMGDAAQAGRDKWIRTMLVAG